MSASVEQQGGLSTLRSRQTRVVLSAKMECHVCHQLPYDTLKRSNYPNFTHYDFSKAIDFDIEFTILINEGGTSPR